MWVCSKCGAEVDAGFEVCWACGTSIDGVEDPTFPGKLAADAIPVETGITATPPPTTEELVTIANFSSAPQAHAARCRLEAEGLRVFMADEETVAMDWLLSNAIGGVKLQVRATDVPFAQDLMARVSREMEEAKDLGASEEHENDSDAPSN